MQRFGDILQKVTYFVCVLLQKRLKRVALCTWSAWVFFKINLRLHLKKRPQYLIVNGYVDNVQHPFVIYKLRRIIFCGYSSRHKSLKNKTTNKSNLTPVTGKAITSTCMILNVSDSGQTEVATMSVSFSLWETVTKANGKLSVLRVFRLLRFGRLLHYLPHLRKQLLVLKRAMKEASSLCLIMLFIIFIFRHVHTHTHTVHILSARAVSVWETSDCRPQDALHFNGCRCFFLFLCSLIGRHLFANQINIKIIREPDRKSFDTLLWSMVTVFQVSLSDFLISSHRCAICVSNACRRHPLHVIQVLTEEDWNLVLYNIMAATSPWASIYFVAIIVTGKHILLNILVGIVIEGFQKQVRTSAFSGSDILYSTKCDL